MVEAGAPPAPGAAAVHSTGANNPPSNRCKRFGFVSSDCTDYEEILKGLAEAWTAYTCPKQMWKEREETVVFILDATKTNALSEATAKKEMAALLDVPPEKVIPKLTRIARQMSASLTGASFKIEPSGLQTMTVTEAAPVRWEWRVTPTEQGQRKLSLTLFVSVGKDEADTYPIQIKTLSEQIDVRVSTWDQALSLLPGVNSLFVAIGGIVTSIMIALGWLYRKAWLPLMSRKSKQP
jgi:hypothetical protein